MAVALVRSVMVATLLLTLATGCTRQPRPIYITYSTGAACISAVSPVFAAADTAPGAPRYTVRGELRTPRSGPPLAKLHIELSGHGVAQVTGRAFVIDSVRPGLYGLITTADGYQQGVHYVTVPIPSDSSLIISMAPAFAGYFCGGFSTQVREFPSRRSWWQVWRRRG